jgi:hypothetical protein
MPSRDVSLVAEGSCRSPGGQAKPLRGRYASPDRPTPSRRGGSYEEDAREVLAKLREVVKAKERGQDFTARRRTVGEWLTEWLDEVKAIDGTRPQTGLPVEERRPMSRSRDTAVMQSPYLPALVRADPERHGRPVRGQVRDCSWRGRRRRHRAGLRRKAVR